MRERDDNVPSFNRSSSQHIALKRKIFINKLKKYRFVTHRKDILTKKQKKEQCITAQRLHFQTVRNLSAQHISSDNTILFIVIYIFSPTGREEDEQKRDNTYILKRKKGKTSNIYIPRTL